MSVSGRSSREQCGMRRRTSRSVIPASHGACLEGCECGFGCSVFVEVGGSSPVCDEKSFVCLSRLRTADVQARAGDYRGEEGTTLVVEEGATLDDLAGRLPIGPRIINARSMFLTKIKSATKLGKGDVIEEEVLHKA